jgi:threonine dehydrogenase-like Zn-dependent dehydrogenase
VKTLCCGICGTDLHAAKHTQQFVERSRRTGGRFVLDPTRDVVFGHEFCCEVVEHGPNTDKRLKPGTLVCSMPLTVAGTTVQGIGYSNDIAGGFAQYMPLAERMLLPVPNGLPATQAALTEPIAVGLHAVRNARLTKDDVPLVIGCGPVGLSVIASLKLENVHPIHAERWHSEWARISSWTPPKPGRSKAGPTRPHRGATTPAVTHSFSVRVRSSVPQ